MKRFLVKCFIVVLLFSIGFLTFMDQSLLSYIASNYSGVESLLLMRDFELKRASGSKTMICTNFAKEISHGSWRTKQGLTDEDISYRKEMDLKIRVSNNWPANLFRNDSRCGKNFPLPGYRIQSLCDPDSAAPCCDTKTGECGSSASHCHCPECTDLRDMKSTELLDWIPRNPACAMKNFTKDEACDFLEKHKIRLAFVGDSLVRQLSTTILLLLSGNLHSGAMPVNASQSELTKCAGEFQITNRDCNIDISAHTVEELRPNSICDGKNSFTLDSVEDYGSSVQTNVLNKVKEMLGQNDSYLILGIGMHYGLNADHVINNFLKTIINLINNEGNGWPRMMWIEVHSLNGFLRMETKFHNDRIEAYNKIINRYLEDMNVTLIKTFNMSSNLKSYDGQHYGLGFNLHKLQIILNVLDKEYERNEIK